MTMALPTGSTQTDLNITLVTSESKKPVPIPSKLGFACHYTPSADGVDENLLILFHGFGDTHLPFARLGQNLKLPQTATLAICGPELIPYLFPEDPPGYQYFSTFTQLGEPISAPNPTAVLASLVSMLKYLIDECNWQEDKVHLFGFGQGGNVVVELARSWSREHADTATATSKAPSTSINSRTGILGSVVTISASLLSHPTPNIKPCLTPLLIVHRPQSSESAITKADVRALKKAFGGRVVVEEIRGNGKEGMPTSREEWMGIMRFWADVLTRRISGEGIYRVT